MLQKVYVVIPDIHNVYDLTPEVFDNQEAAMKVVEDYKTSSWWMMDEDFVHCFEVQVQSIADEETVPTVYIT